MGSAAAIQSDATSQKRASVPAAQARRPPAREPERRGSPPVLVAGRDSARRATLLDELARSMPDSTTFEVAGRFSEVMERAPGSRMVILTEDLPDAPAESLTRVLGRRHPRLPVMRLDAPASQAELGTPA
jgi:hypothetical protein